MTKFDAPQADRLDLMRRVIESVGTGLQATKAIAAATHLTERYVRYALQAARQLGLLQASDEGHQLIAPATRLLATPRGSRAERAVLVEQLRGSETFAPLAGTLLGDRCPSRLQIAELLLADSDASLSTALRRASTLLAWRRYLVDDGDGVQLRIEGLEWGDEDTVEPPAPPRQQKGVIPIVLAAEDTLGTPEDIAEGESAPLPSSSDASIEEDRPPPSAVVDGELPEAIELPRSTIAADRAPAEPPVEPPRDPILQSNELAYMRGQLARGQLILFTGAGFALGTCDVQGRPLPTGAAFAKELWELCYPDEAYDQSSLQDVFEYAHRMHRRRLDDLLRMRFTIDPKSIPESYEWWFAMPWAKIYTLNVDDLEAAAARRFDLPRDTTTVSALTASSTSNNGSLDTTHLNGVALDGADGVTFSGSQFASRLGRQEPLYAHLSAEMLSRPFVFVGTPLVEELLWQHIGMRQERARASEREMRPKSFLVSPSLSRARRDKLSAYNIVWVKATAEEFAVQVLASMGEASQRGHAVLAAGDADALGDERNIIEVADALLKSTHSSDFLLGEEPTWADIRTGRAVDRTEDGRRLELLSRVVDEPRTRASRTPVVVISGTAGSGKSTFLMKAASHLHGQGHRVAWLGAQQEVAPAVLRRYFRSPNRQHAVVLDDGGRYGTQLVSVLSDLASSESVSVIVVGLRSHHERLLELPGAEGLLIERHAIGALTDADIDRLIGALERERRLGRLRAMSAADRRAAFRDSAQRQILVAMIEATSGEKFEDRVVDEWRQQGEVERYVYALAALATGYSYPLRRDEVLLACGGGTRELDAVHALVRSRLLVKDELNRYRVRHRVIAEKLVDELASRGTQLQQIVVGFCRALAVQTGGASDGRNSRRNRVLSRLLNHNALLRLLDEVEHARSVYAQVQEELKDNHHFWLQRGCLELEGGSIPHAENFLEQSRALCPDDPLVETAYAHMRLRKAIANPSAPGAAPAAADAFETLRTLIRTRGSRDHVPAHVFGSQALGWVRRAGLTPRARRELLREALDVVAAARGMHRSRTELDQLHEDLRREQLVPH